jgi:cytochrome c oxidase accessory protein FixG
MCPYARFQGAMFDRDTLIISYDDARGEPRGSRRKSADPGALGLGDCIDCLACVQVCPTGIDIRNGLQVGCIACAACIDACDAVMEKMEYPKGLIRYTTENALAGKRVRVVRARTLVYAALLLALVSGFAWSVTHRSMLLAEVIRDRNALWRPGPAGTVENSYTIKLVNKSEREIELEIRVSDPAYTIVGKDEIEVEGGAVTSIPLTLRAATTDVHGRRDVTLEFVEETSHHHGDDDAAESIRTTTRFFAPESP